MRKINEEILTNGPKKFWVVTKPTEGAELADVVFKSNFKHLFSQIRGGLDEDEVYGIYTSESLAYKVAQKLLRGLLDKNVSERKQMKLSKEQLKEMVRKVVRRKLDERFDQGDRDWARSIESDALFKMINSAKMTPITRQKMDQVLDAIKKRDDLLFFLLQPKNKMKIQAAIKKGEFDNLADALEKMVVQAGKKKPN